MWSLRCSWSIACRRCSNYIFILNLTPGSNGLGKDNCKTRWEAFIFWDWVRLILENWRYIARLRVQQLGQGNTAKTINALHYRPFMLRVYHWCADPHKGPIRLKTFPCHGVITTLMTPDKREHSSVDYRQVPNIRRTLVGNKIVDNSDVVGASPVGAAPTTSSLST